MVNNGITKRKQVDYQVLIDIVQANQRAVGFDLSSWCFNCDDDGDYYGSNDACGTFGCLVGNYLLENWPSLVGGPIDDAYAAVTKLSLEGRWGLPKSHWNVLFASENHLSDVDEVGVCAYKSAARDPYNRTAAIARVSKYVYYFLRKRELMADDTARFIEGDWHVTNQVIWRTVRLG